MLRKEIISGVKTILTMLAHYDVAKTLSAAIREPKEGKPQLQQLLQLYGDMQVNAQKFGDIERTVVDFLGLKPLFVNQFYTSLLVGDPNLEVRKTVRSVYDAEAFLPKFVQLIEQEDVKVTEDKTKTVTKGDELSGLTLFVLEEENQLSTAERIIISLQSIEGLYGAVSDLENEHKNNLTIVSCDSGSDKSFDFLGAAQIMVSIKDIILSFWDNIVYYREDKTGRHLDLVAASLPIFERIADMQTKGKIEPETAEILKRQITESVKKFARAGATIPEIEKNTFYSPRQLMKPEPKLLMAPAGYENVKKAKVAAVSNKFKKPVTAKKKTAVESIDVIDISNMDTSDPEFARFMLQMAAEYKKRKGDTGENKEEES